jgi:hypothetical protein
MVIKERAIPHSHPVLTLNTRNLDSDDQLLSAFLHEQLHWYLDAHKPTLKRQLMICEPSFNPFRRSWTRLAHWDRRILGTLWWFFNRTWRVRVWRERHITPTANFRC